MKWLLNSIIISHHDKLLFIEIGSEVLYLGSSEMKMAGVHFYQCQENETETPSTQMSLMQRIFTLMC